MRNFTLCLYSTKKICCSVTKYINLTPSPFFLFQAALEAMDELDVFGSLGGYGSIIHVQADQIQYCKV